MNKLWRGHWTVIVAVMISYGSYIVSGKISTRCFVCRSRGELGDCKDPFANNATSIQELPGRPVTVTSCPSGWCRKQMEGIRGPADDYGSATERACLPNSPPDQEERCAEVTIRNKVTLLCVCRGDLCNSATNFKQKKSWISILISLSIVFLGTTFTS